MSNVRNWKRQKAMSAFETGRNRVQCQRSKLEETECSVSVRHQKSHTATSKEPCCKTDHKVLSELPPWTLLKTVTHHWPLNTDHYLSLFGLLFHLFSLFIQDVYHMMLSLSDYKRSGGYILTLLPPPSPLPIPVPLLYLSHTLLFSPILPCPSHYFAPPPPPLSLCYFSLSFFLLLAFLSSFFLSLYLTLFSFLASPSFYTIPQSSSPPPSCLSLCLPPPSRHSLSHSLVIQPPPLLFCVLPSPISLPPSTSTFLSI